MSAYIVKLPDGDLVGIFCPDTLAGLPSLIDECCDIDGCLYKKIPSGGVMWPAPVIIRSTEDEDAPGYLEQATETGDWWNAIYDAIHRPGTVTGWKPVADIYRKAA